MIIKISGFILVGLWILAISNLELWIVWIERMGFKGRITRCEVKIGLIRNPQSKIEYICRLSSVD